MLINFLKHRPTQEGKSVLALLIVFLLSACHPVSTDEKTGKKVFTLQVNQYQFNIPKGYVWAYDRGKNGTIIGANLHALYPEFEPKTQKNNDVFEQIGRGGGRVITFLINGPNEGRSISEIIIKRLNENKEKNKDFKKGKFYIYPVRDEKKELMLLSPNGHDEVYFYCGKENSVPFPSCRVRFYFNEDIYISAVFSKTLLDQESEIIDGLETLINSFYRPSLTTKSQGQINVN